MEREGEMWMQRKERKGRERKKESEKERAMGWHFSQG